VSELDNGMTYMVAQEFSHKGWLVKITYLEAMEPFPYGWRIEKGDQVRVDLTSRRSADGAAM
jgi:hypothetical protein